MTTDHENPAGVVLSQKCATVGQVRRVLDRYPGEMRIFVEGGRNGWQYEAPTLEDRELRLG